LGQQIKAYAARKAFDNSYGIVNTCNQAFSFFHFFWGGSTLFWGQGRRLKFEDRLEKKGRRTTWFKVFVKNSGSRKN